MRGAWWVISIYIDRRTDEVREAEIFVLTPNTPTGLFRALEIADTYLPGVPVDYIYMEGVF